MQGSLLSGEEQGRIPPQPQVCPSAHPLLTLTATSPTFRGGGGMVMCLPWPRWCQYLPLRAGGLCFQPQRSGGGGGDGRLVEKTVWLEGLENQALPLLSQERVPECVPVGGEGSCVCTCALRSVWTLAWVLLFCPPSATETWDPPSNDRAAPGKQWEQSQAQRWLVGLPDGLWSQEGLWESPRLLGNAGLPGQLGCSKRNPEWGQLGAGLRTKLRAPAFIPHSGWNNLATC